MYSNENNTYVHHGYSQASIKDYLKESADVSGLHEEIKACDSVLERMEHMLTRFQADLGAISSEIKHLQDKSMSMRIKLKNRKAVHKDLDAHIKSIFISPELVRCIHEAEIKESYIGYLADLDVKIQYLKQLQKEGKLDKASRDMAPLCERTKVKAIARIRQFLLQRVYLLKKPQTNIQIKQNLLLRFKYLYQFCRLHAPSTADEIRNIYTDTVRKIYNNHFKQYLLGLMKLQAPIVAKKGDVLGLDETKTGGMFSMRKTSLHLSRVFMLGNRDTILSNIDKPPIIYHSAAKRHTQFRYNEIFRATHRLLMDTATTESAFLSDFFQEADAYRGEDQKERKASAKRGTALFDTIFSKTTSMFLENLENYLMKCFDCLELLILVRIVLLHSQMMRQRQTDCLDSLFDRINMLLWPRFKVVLDAHLASIRTVRVSSVSRGNTSVHYVSRRYAEFAAGIDVLNRGYDDAIIVSNMGRMRTAVCKLLTDLSGRIGGEKGSTVFLINNYDAILKVFDDKNLVSEAAKAFRELMHTQVAKYVEMELGDKFQKLIGFVQSSEEKISEAVERKQKLPALDLQTAGDIIRSFANGWKTQVAQIDKQVNSHFGSSSQNPETAYQASEILKQILIQLVLYYQRLQDVIKKCHRRPPGFMKDLVPIPTIMHEIKKFGAK
ncbi:hypothetical protein AAMO2058_000419400 [Amorphochlora amoebiformis]